MFPSMLLPFSSPSSGNIKKGRRKNHCVYFYALYTYPNQARRIASNVNTNIMTNEDDALEETKTNIRDKH